MADALSHPGLASDGGDPKSHIERLHQEDDDMAALTDAQFAELKALLQPGYELSTLMLAQYKAQSAAQQPPEEEPQDGQPAAEIAETAGDPSPDQPAS